MEEQKRVIVGIDWATALCEALGVDVNMTRRIVLDIKCDTPVLAYVEMYGDTQILELDWSALVGSEMRFVTPTSEQWLGEA